MRINKLLYLIILLNVFCQPTKLFCQNSKALEKLESEAKYYFAQSALHLALPLYLKLDSISPNNPHYLFPIGVCYLNTSYEEDKALFYFEKCLAESEKYPPSLHYYAAKAYHLSHKMNEAIAEFELYKSHLHAKKNKAIIEKTNREIEMCKNGKLLMAKPVNIDIINLGSQINSIYPDYAAFLSADQNELIFTSCRPNTTGGSIDALDGRYHEDLYISFHSDSGWSEPVNMGDSVNTNGQDASITLSADGQTLFLFRYDPDPMNNSSGDIYISELHGKTWSKAKPLPATINSKSHELGASLSSDGNILYFSSDRPGGYGGIDIYMVRKLPNEDWAIPVNLGSNINTAYDEDSPFIHSDGKTLFFSSNGHNSMGGLDIFSSTYNSEKQNWSPPENVGYPISTAHDDININWTADGRKLYFSSRRSDSYGDQDIYYGIINKEESTEVLVMKGFILDSLNQQPIQGEITVTDIRSNQVVGVFKSNSATGKYLIVLPEGHYTMKIEAENHMACDQALEILDLHGFKVMDKNITLCPSSILNK